MATNDTITRVALYIRVSTEEQALHGYSLDAQESALVEYAEQHGYKIVGIYRDEGFSARKPATKRLVMQQLLRDVEARKVDLIIFTKLDRWFRSVGDYHTVQRVLDKNKVVWRAVLEDYQTETADGRLKVNIMLSVAENEADRTAERIKFVFNSRVQKGEAPFPTHVAPYGYKVEIIDGIRRLVKNPDTQEVTEYFFRQAISKSVRYAGRSTNQKYGTERGYLQWYHMIKNPAYYGTYHGVDGYCEPYITKEEFDRLNDNPQQIRKAQQNRVYLFAGIIKCGHCGRRMVGKYNKSGSTDNEYMYYRCPNTIAGLCPAGTLSERKIESYLMENVRAEMRRQIVEYEATQATPKQQKKKADVSKLRERLRRVNVSYQAGNMSDDEYLATAAEIKDAIANAQKGDKETPKVDINALKEFLASDFETIYGTLSREERRELWCSIIDHITIFDRSIQDIKFRA